MNAATVHLQGPQTKRHKTHGATRGSCGKRAGGLVGQRHPAAEAGEHDSEDEGSLVSVRQSVHTATLLNRAKRHSATMGIYQPVRQLPHLARSSLCDCGVGKFGIAVTWTPVRPIQSLRSPSLTANGAHTSEVALPAYFHAYGFRNNSL
jgi:hypothetical protein